MSNEEGFIEELGMGILALIVIFLISLIPLMIFSQISWSEQNVSGIVYNTTNNSAISGNTRFSVRAAVDTYVSEENQSSYCLPPNSQYKELVNKAAADKNIKVQVTTNKGFWLKAPWTCINNVTVKEIK
jgi:hypothetical protein